MKVLFVGDLIGKAGIKIFKKSLSKIKSNHQIDLCIVNGENSSSAGKGIALSDAENLIHMGVDVITMGNHTFFKNDIEKIFDNNMPVIRPANMFEKNSGSGYILIDNIRYTIAVINLLGQTYMNPVNSPFEAVDKILSEIEDKADVIIVDFHAEATSEKYALANYIDGRVSAVLGTHTHVQTADERILEQGTGYITDVGMTGPYDSVLGIKKDIAVKKFLYSSFIRFDIAEGLGMINGVILDIDEKTGKTISIERINELMEEY